MVTVWMNHWFSTAVNIIALLRENNPDLRVIGSNEREYSVIRSVCDEWYVEPSLKDDEYVEYCLSFCREHGVQVFMPRRGLLKISESLDRFRAQGVLVMADRYEMVSLFSRKDEAFRYFAGQEIGAVPAFRIVRTADEFLAAYDALSREFAQVCFKFVKDEGGKSYRLIDNSRRGYAALFKKQTTRITLDEALSALSERETFAPVMVMPYLSGDEVSVDCLQTPSGLIALPRVKTYEKYETLRFDDEILDLCGRFQRAAGLECPYNIQFKYLDGVPYFLEVNTRMSGGVQMACCASGVNLPRIALNKLLGVNESWHVTPRTRIVAQLLQPIVLD